MMKRRTDMRCTINPSRAAILIGLLTALAAGCSSDGYSGGSTSVSSSYYYSNGWYNDPYYYGYYPPGAVVVRPPGVSRSTGTPGVPGTAHRQAAGRGNHAARPDSGRCDDAAGAAIHQQHGVEAIGFDVQSLPHARIAAARVLVIAGLPSTDVPRWWRAAAVGG